MYEVILWPSKCPSEGSWIHKHKDGERHILSNVQYEYHKKHGCMKPIERYIMVTIDKKKCSECETIVIKRKKIVLEKF